MNDPYATLGVPRTATPAQIRAAWKLLSQRNHPDRGGDPTRAAEINEAWTCLSDEVRRLRYDARGEDAPADSVDVEARKMLHDMFNAAISAEQIVDLVAFVKQQLTKTASDLTRGIFDQQQLVKRLTKKRGRVRTKDPASNIVHAIIDQCVRQAEASIEHQKLGILVVATATGLMQDYEFVPDEMPPTSSTSDYFGLYQPLTGVFR